MSEWTDGYDQAMADVEELKFVLTQDELLILSAALFGLSLRSEADGVDAEELLEMRQLQARLVKQIRTLDGHDH